ncbi:DNA polymerase sliding clamp [Haloglomus halophilum]|uniref:DNA polymerase sliding clamp n=1 Tax=Haloglomus halophilum TaxID=2962672 RepID=UPI0020CA2324|nr:DNA polymerase sliding clamp [Haloglomus halophilum]
MSTNTESETDAQPPTPTEPDVEDAEIEIEAEVEADSGTAVDPTPELETDVEVEPAVDPEEGEDTDVETEAEVETEKDVEVNEDADSDADIKEEKTVVTGPPHQFQAALKGGVIKEFVGTLRAIVDEAKISVSPDGLHARAVDPANVAMYDIELSTGAFESFDASEGVLGMNLERFEEVLKLAKKDDLVQLSFNTTTFKLVIHIDGVEFTMALIDPDSIRNDPEIPNMDLPISFTIGEAQISRGVKAADMVSDHIRFRCDETEQAVFIEAEGDTDNVSFELAADDLVALTASDGRSLFSLDYVKDISKQFPKNTEIEMTFGTDFPMMIEYGFADGECNVLAMLAPRIESD